MAATGSKSRFGSTYGGNPLRPVIIAPSVNKPVSAGNPVDVTVGTTDSTKPHFVQVYDSKGNLIGSEPLKLLGSAGDGTLSCTVTTTGMNSGETYFIRVYAFVDGEELSHCISVTVV